MKQRANPQNHGFTLIEMLIGVALMALIFVSLVALMTRSAQASRTAVVAASSNASMTKTADQFGQDLESGMNILAGASKTQLNFLRLGLATNFVMPSWETIVNQSSDDNNGNFTEDKKTLSAYGPPLTSLVGRDVVVVDQIGNYIMTKVVSSVANPPRGDNTVTAKTTFTCMMSMVGPYKIYPYDSLNYIVNGNGLTRVKNGTETVLAPGVSKAAFSALFVNKGEVQFTDSVTVPTLHYDNAPFVGINYTLNSAGEHPTTGWGTARVALAGVFQKGCNDAVKVPYNNTGKLQVNTLYNGQPTAPAAGINPNVSVSGVTPIPNITTWDTIVYDKLRAGTYSVSAPDITQGSTIYHATLTNNPGVVGNGRGASINVNYEKVKGKVNIQVTGLPAGTPSNAGTVTISGPDPMTVPAINGTTPLQLTPGNYSFSATTVNGYIPTISTTTLTVNSTTSTTVTVSYALPTGPLSVGVQGLPAGNSAPISVSGPQSQTLNVVTGTTQSVSLQTGTYTVSAPDVTVEGTVYSPDKPSQSVGLGTGGASVIVTYSKATNPGTPTSPPTSGNKARIRLGVTPTGGSFTLTTYAANGGKLDKVNQQLLNGGQIYEVDADYYYNIELSAPKTDDSNDGCVGGEAPDGTCPSHRFSSSSSKTEWNLDSNDLQSNTVDKSTNPIGVKLAKNSLSSVFGVLCESKWHESGSLGGVISQHSSSGCTPYDPRVISDADAQAIVNIFTKLVESNGQSMWQTAYYNATHGLSAPSMAQTFTAQGLTADQKLLWDNSYFVAELDGNQDWEISYSCDAFKVANCKNLKKAIKVVFPNQ